MADDYNAGWTQKMLAKRIGDAGASASYVDNGGTVVQAFPFPGDDGSMLYALAGADGEIAETIPATEFAAKWKRADRQGRPFAPVVPGDWMQQHLPNPPADLKAHIIHAGFHLDEVVKRHTVAALRESVLSDAPFGDGVPERALEAVQSELNVPGLTTEYDGFGIAMAHGMKDVMADPDAGGNLAPARRQELVDDWANHVVATMAGQRRRMTPESLANFASTLSRGYRRSEGKFCHEDMEAAILARENELTVKYGQHPNTKVASDGTEMRYDDQGHLEEVSHGGNTLALAVGGIARLIKALIGAITMPFRAAFGRHG